MATAAARAACLTVVERDTDTLSEALTARETIPCPGPRRLPSFGTDKRNMNMQHANSAPGEWERQRAREEATEPKGGAGREPRQEHAHEVAQEEEQKQGEAQELGEEGGGKQPTDVRGRVPIGQTGSGGHSEAQRAPESEALAPFRPEQAPPNEERAQPGEPEPTPAADSTEAAEGPSGAPEDATGQAKLARYSRRELEQEIVRLQKSLEDMERASREAATFHSNLLKSVGQAIICSDLSGKISYWNDAAGEIYGWSAEEVVGQNILDTLRAPNASLAEEGPKIMEQLVKGHRWTGEWSIITKSGIVVDLVVVDTPVMSDEGQLVGVIGVSTDITELKRKEAEILRLNAELEARVKERTQQLEHSNARLREEIQEHLQAREHLHRVAKDMEQSRTKIMQQAEKLEKMVVELRAARLEAESASRLKSQFLACMSHEIRTPMNAVIGMTNLILSTPLTEEQRQYVETIRTSGDALLSIIDDILDLSKIEAGELTLEPRTFSPLLCVEEAVDMVAVKAQESGLELVSFVDSSVPILALSDPYRFRQVLTNLLSNALKFTEKGEVVIEVKALPWEAEGNCGQSHGEPAPSPPATDYSDGCSSLQAVEGESDEGHTRALGNNRAGAGARDKGGIPLHAVPAKVAFRTATPVLLSPHAPRYRLLVSVRDTGIGIPPERMSRLFRPFSQGDSSTTRRFGGTGLGLVISKQLVEMLGGRIWVESAGENKGSTFFFSIALYPTDTDTLSLLPPPLSATQLLPRLGSEPGPGVLPSPTDKGDVHPAGANNDMEISGSESTPQALPEQFPGPAVPAKEIGWKEVLGRAINPTAPPPAPRLALPLADGLLKVSPLEPLQGLHACLLDRNASARACLAKHLRALGMRVTLCASAGSLLDRLSSLSVVPSSRKSTSDAGGSAQPLNLKPGEVVGAAISGGGECTGDGSLLDSSDPDVLIFDTETPGVADIRGARIVQYRAHGASSRQLERRKIVQMCPYGTANQVMQHCVHLEEHAQAQHGGAANEPRAAEGPSSAVISKPVHQTHLTKALLLLFAPKELGKTEEPENVHRPKTAAASEGAPGAAAEPSAVAPLLSPVGELGRHPAGGDDSCEPASARRTASGSTPGQHTLTGGQQPNLEENPPAKRAKRVASKGGPDTDAPPDLAAAVLSVKIGQDVCPNALEDGQSIGKVSPHSNDSAAAAASPPAAAAGGSMALGQPENAGLNMPRALPLPCPTISRGPSGANSNNSVGTIWEGKEAADTGAGTGTTNNFGNPLGNSSTRSQQGGEASSRLGGLGQDTAPVQADTVGLESSKGTAAAETGGRTPLGMTMATSSVSVSGSASGTLLIRGPAPRPQGTGLRFGLGQKHPLSILLVEDNLVNQRVASRMLSHMGYTVDVAGNGAEAIKALDVKQYDLIFMDIQMPVMDGIEATQRIHIMSQERKCPRPRIVAMTANVLHSDRLQCLNAGMDGFLSKPIRVADLVAALEQTPLQRRQQQPEEQHKDLQQVQGQGHQ